jgi:hypothetical protein
VIEPVDAMIQRHIAESRALPKAAPAGAQVAHAVRQAQEVVAKCRDLEERMGVMLSFVNEFVDLRNRRSIAAPGREAAVEDLFKRIRGRLDEGGWYVAIRVKRGV